MAELEKAFSDWLSSQRFKVVPVVGEVQRALSQSEQLAAALQNWVPGRTHLVLALDEAGRIGARQYVGRELWWSGWTTAEHLPSDLQRFLADFLNPDGFKGR